MWRVYKMQIDCLLQCLNIIFFRIGLGHVEHKPKDCSWRLRPKADPSTTSNSKESRERTSEVSSLSASHKQLGETCPQPLSLEKTGHCWYSQHIGSPRNRGCWEWRWARSRVCSVLQLVSTCSYCGKFAACLLGMFSTSLPTITKCWKALSICAELQNWKKDVF